MFYSPLLDIVAITHEWILSENKVAAADPDLPTETAKSNGWRQPGLEKHGKLANCPIIWLFLLLSLKTIVIFNFLSWRSSQEGVSEHLLTIINWYAGNNPSFSWAHWENVGNFYDVFLSLWIICSFSLKKNVYCLSCWCKELENI